ncbi:MAG: hypothetical protein J0I11_21315 [Actinobacteria bacterium]|nr:hypothetical protein [Actinomycetota bacterium]
MGRHSTPPIDLAAPPRSRVRRAIALLTSLALVLALAVVGALGTSVANADTASGVYNVTVTGISTHDGKPVVEDGKNASLSFEYNANAAGKTATLDFPSAGGTWAFTPPVTATCDAGNVPRGNDSIDCIGFAGDTLTVKFKGDFAGSGGGVFGMDFKVTGLTGNTSSNLSWKIADGAPTDINVIVAKDTGDFAPTANAFGKTRDNSTLNLDGYITIDASGDPQVAAGKNLADLTVKYTVELVRTQAGTYTLADALDDPLTLDVNSFTCSLTTWDTEGLNSTNSACGAAWNVTSSTAAGFTGTATFTGPSKIVVTYKAYPDQAKLLAAIKTWLTTGAGNTSAPATYTWDSVQNSVTVNGAEPQRVSTKLTWSKKGVTQGSNSKAVTPSVLNSCVTITGGTVNASGCNGMVLDYTITYYSNRAAAGTVSVKDTLPAGMTYETGTFAAKQSSWTTTPYPPVEGSLATITFASGPAVSGSPESFTAGIDVPAAPAKTVITYQAKITDVAALQTDLQNKYDALGAASGGIQSTLTNSATFDGSGTKSATVTVSASKSTGITPGTAFGKNVDWTSRTVTGNADGTLPAPAAVTYALSANLTNIEASAPNIVISDTLPAGMTWDGTVSRDAASSGSLVLSKQPSCSTTDPDNFAKTTSAGAYCISGTTLLINVGNSNTTNVVINAPATIGSALTGVTGTAAGANYPSGTKKYSFPNTANFYYGGASPQQKSKTSDLYVRPQPTGEDGYHVDSIFKKTTNVSGELHVNPGDSATIKYTFTVGAGHDIDARTSTITDYIDATVFDLGTNLSNVAVAGTYNNQPLDDSKFVLDQDEAGNLLISLSPAGKSIVDTQGVDMKWVVTITLTTKPFEGKETHSIYNKAVLTGGADQAKYWSDVTAEATSYGNEWEAQKLIYDAHATSGAAWVTSVDSFLDHDGNLMDTPFVYQIDFIAHGNYGTTGVEPPAIVDALPTGVTFLGFIDPNIVGTPGFADAVKNASDTSTQTLGGNLEASVTGGTVTVQRKSGMKFQRTPGDDGHYRVYFAAKVESSDGTDIVNAITGGRTATIKPIKASVTWQKTDSSGQNLLGGSQWTITGPSGPDSSTIAVIDNGAEDADATVGRFLVKPLAPGSYTLTETKAPAGYLLDSAPHAFVIDEGHTAVDLGAIANRKQEGGSGGTTDPSTTPTTAPTTPVTTPTTPVTTPTTAVTTPTTGHPTTTQPPLTTTLPAPNQCADLVETGFRPGETVTVRVSGPDGQYELSATADANGTVHVCLRASHPQTVTVEVLGENRHVVRDVTIGGCGR